MLLVALAALLGQPSNAHADDARGVGYVLSFRMGVEQAQAENLGDKLAKATTDWLGRSAKQGASVAKNCGGNKDCVRKAAASLGVSRLGIVTIVAAGGVVRVEVKLLDARAGSEILRTHAEFESNADGSNATKAIFDLMPRLLPGEKVVPDVVAPPPPPPKDPVVVPPVTQIPDSPPPTSPGADLTAASPKKSGTRWWLWGGLGAAAATASIVAAILITRDDGSSAPVLELPPPQ